jgi:serine/threonine-protein kinase
MAVSLAALLLSPSPPAEVERFSLAPLPGQSTNYEFDISDDGTAIVLSVAEAGASHLSIRRLGDLAATAIPGTERGVSPILSPDGTEVAFIAEGELRIAPIAGGVVRSLTDSVSCCARWGTDGYVYYSNVHSGVSRVASAGGAVETVTEITPDGGEFHGYLVVSSDPDVAVMNVWGNPNRLEAVRLSTGERSVLSAGVRPFFTDGGVLVFASLEGQILAARLDTKTLALDGTAVPLVDGVRVDGDADPFYSVARDGTLLYWTGASTAGSDGRVVRVDRTGEVTPVDPNWLFNPGTPEVALALSPDGQRLAVKITSDTGDDIWVKQLDDGPLSRLTFDDAVDRRPRWSPDGRNIMYNSDRLQGTGHYDLWTQPADGTGTPEVLLDLEGSILEVQITPDESMFALRLGGLANVFGVRDIVSLRAGETETAPVAADPYDEKAVALSPDGRWAAYESTETGRDEIYVRPFPNAQDGKWQVSTLGGINPKWAHSGRELFYINGSGEMVAAGVRTTASTFEVTNQRALFQVSDRGLDGATNYASWDVDVDDQHFIMIQFGAGDTTAGANQFVLVQNWITEVKERLGH